MSLSTKSWGAESDASGDYNLLLGPVALRAVATIDGTYNDNINTSKLDKVSDFIVSPSIAFIGRWNVTDFNTLSFNLGVGYEEYIMHPEDSGITIAPNSQVSVKFSIGDVFFTVSDTISYQQDPTLVGQLSNTTRFPTLSNTARISARWDMTDVIALSATYGHGTQKVFTDQYNYLDYDTDSISPEITYKITDTIHTGISATASSRRYEEGVENDSTSFEAGPFVRAQISSNLSANAQVSYTMTQYDKGGSIDDNQSSVNSFTGSAGITHQINEAFTQSLSIGKDYLPGLTSNYTDRTYGRYRLDWFATNAISLSGGLTAEYLVDSDSFFSQTSTRIQGNLTAGYSLTTKMTLSLSYYYTLKNSNIDVLSYDQNRISADCSYRF